MLSGLASDRKPTSLEEPSSGLWLRLVNNCRLPIRVLGFDIGTGDPGLGLTHSVVAESAIADNEILTEMPKGYPFHVGSRITIPGGKDVLFSIPANHVTKDWHIEIDFTFALTDPKEGAHPSGKVLFGWDGIPVVPKKSVRR